MLNMNTNMMETTSNTPIEVLLRIDDEGYTTARNLYEFLELDKSNYAKWCKRNIINNHYAKENVDYIIMPNVEATGRGNFIDYKITLDFAYKLACATLSGRNIYMSAEEKVEKLKVFNRYEKIVFEKKEIAFKNLLISALKGYGIDNVIHQYKVMDYRIDFYIPELKIAIEYDENNHINYSYEAQELRQWKIENTIGCKFIRLSDEHSDGYNLGKIFAFLNINQNI